MRTGFLRGRVGERAAACAVPAKVAAEGDWCTATVPRTARVQGAYAVASGEANAKSEDTCKKERDAAAADCGWPEGLGSGGGSDNFVDDGAGLLKIGIFGDVCDQAASRGQRNGAAASGASEGESRGAGKFGPRSGNFGSEQKEADGKLKAYSFE